jgi:phenylpyruvate tautomerase PptA (4-oxalocrotonate tautomerase family)
VARRVTDVVAEEVGAQHDRVNVVFREYPMTDSAQGGVTLAAEAKGKA